MGTLVPVSTKDKLSGSKHGVDTVPELAQRNPGNLYEAMEATNAEKKLVRQLPTCVQVESWVDQAKALPRVINY